jgi:hypothetical protein
MQTTNVSEGILTSHINDESMPTVDVDMAMLANQNGGKWLSSWHGTKPISQDGTIRSVTASGLEGKIDEFKLRLYTGAVGTFRTTKAGQFRDYDVIINSVSIKREPHEVTIAPFHVEYTVVSAYGYRPDVYYRTTFSGVTTSPFDVNILSSGNAPYLPIIRFKVNSATQLGSLSLRNLATGEVMTFARQFNAGENLELNLESGQIVNINGSGVTYSGIQLTFIATSGINPLRITTLSGTQNYDISVAYKPRYL